MLLHYLVKLLCSKIVNYIARKKGATRFVRKFQIILHLISWFLACSVAMDQTHRWVIKYFSCLLGNAVLTVEWSNLDHAVVPAAIHRHRLRFLACVQAGGGHFEHHFSHPLSTMQTC